MQQSLWLLICHYIESKVATAQTALKKCLLFIRQAALFTGSIKLSIWSYQTVPANLCILPQ